jgi:hypothetical protein
MLKNKFLRTIATIRLILAAGVFSAAAAIIAPTPALAGKNCTWGVCGVVDSYVGWALTVARDSQDHWYCKNPYKGPVQLLPAWATSNLWPLYWKDTDCYWNGRFWQRVWVYTPVFPS